MATFTIGEAMSRIPKLLDRVADHAVEYMSEYISANANQGYQTGALAGSIKKRTISESSRGVGTSLESKSSGHVYGKYVDKGRGPVKAHNPSGRLHYYDPKLGKWMHPKSVGPMKGIGFIAATKEHLENTYFSL